MQNAISVCSIVLAFSKKRGIKLEVRSWASSDAELERLLRPNRVDTASNYCKLIERLFEYCDSHPNS
jgi:hypothetical protein